MPVTEAPMRPGFGTVNLIPETPLSVTKQVTDLIEGVGCSVIITPVPMDTSLGDAALLAAALYTGRVTARPTRTQVDFTGLSSWLDSVRETELAKTSGTPTQWLTDLLINGLSVGTVTGGSNVTYTVKAYEATYRGALDLVAEMGTWEYDVRPDFTVNAGSYANLFESPPRVVITARAEGDDGTYFGLLGTIPGPNIDASNAATKVVAVGQGDGAAINFGSATQSLTLKDPDGNTPVLVQTINAPSQTSAGASTVASAVIGNLGGAVKSIRVSTGGTMLAGDSTGTRINLARPGGGMPLDGVGTGIRTGSKSPNAGYKGRATAVARMALGRTGNRRGFSQQSSQSQFVRRFLRPGDEVYVYDLEAGILDTANQITYRGETISPALVRCTLMTWAIEQGYGIYIRSNAASPTLIDLTPYVQWEAPGAQIDVSDWTPASYGVSNRTDPALAARVAGTAPGWSTLSLGSANWTGTGQWRYEGGRVWLSGTLTRTTSSFPAGSTLFSMGSGGNPPAPPDDNIILGAARIASVTPDDTALVWIADVAGGTFDTTALTHAVAVSDLLFLDGISWPLT